MATQADRVVVVTGATGLQGGAVAEHLLAQGWRVRALTRNANSPKARALAARGAEVVQGDMSDPAAMARLLEGAYGGYSVQNPVLSGKEGEIRQGKNVADAAQQAGLQHLVYGSAGTGLAGTGIPSWESKRIIEQHMRALGLPLTVFRPMAFMELMTEPKFFPAVGAWHLMPKLMGSTRPVPWLSVRDLGVIVARAFAEPERSIGQAFALASDVKSIDEWRILYQAELGRKPPRFPMPPWLFERFGYVGQDLSRMWRWLATHEIPLDTQPARATHRQALTVQAWLMTQRQKAT